MNPDIVEVVQDDRQEAADLMCIEAVNRGFSPSDEAGLRASVLSGAFDQSAPVQAFARHRIAALTAARPAIMAWQPIETAPRDGTEIDVWIDGEFPQRRPNVQWREPTDSEWWVHGGDTIETPDATWHDCFGPLGKDEPPTHWQPLPAPPATAIRAAVKP